MAAKPAPKVKPAPPKPEVKAAPKPPEPKPAPKPPEPKAAPRPPVPRPEVKPRPAPRPEAKPAPKPAAKPAPKATPKPAPKAPKPPARVTVVAQTASYDADQIANQKTVVRLCESDHVPHNGILGALCAGAGENDWHTDGCNSSNHCGFWQLNSTWQAMHDYHDVEYWTRYAIQHGFYGHGGISHIAKSNPSLSPGWIAQYCQGAGPTDAAAAAYYETYVGVAAEVYNRWKSSAGTGPPAASQIPGVPQIAPAYVNPLAAAKVTPSRIDMGCDYAGTGHYACFAACEITAATNNTSGWTTDHPGGYVEYKVTQPGPFEGDYFYCAEGITTHRKVGDKLKAGEYICSIRPGWPTGTEIGQAAGNGNEQTWAAVFGGGYSEGDCTASGRAFAMLLHKLGEQRLPVCQGPQTGLWPRWAHDGNLPDLSGAIALSVPGVGAPAKPSESASTAASSYTWPTDQLAAFIALAHESNAAAGIAAGLKKYVSGVTFLKTPKG